MFEYGVGRYFITFFQITCIFLKTVRSKSSTIRVISCSTRCLCWSIVRLILPTNYMHCGSFSLFQIFHTPALVNVKVKKKTFFLLLFSAYTEYRISHGILWLLIIKIYVLRPCCRWFWQFKLLSCMLKGFQTFDISHVI